MYGYDDGDLRDEQMAIDREREAELRGNLAADERLEAEEAREQEWPRTDG